MAPTLDQLDYIFPGPDRTELKQFSIDPKLTSFRLQYTWEYALQ